MNLIWKVGKTYHLCGEGSETEINTAIAGESFRLFLPVFDITEGIRFVSDGWFQPESLFDLPWPGEGVRKTSPRPRRWLFRDEKRRTGME